MDAFHFHSVNGKIFDMPGCMYDSNLSVLAPGYIITPNGECVVVMDGCDHADVFSMYIYQFLECDYVFYQSTKAIQILTGERFQCVVYTGIRPKDMVGVYQAGSNRLTNTEGYGIFFLPMNKKMTKEQKLACENLLNSNKSLFGNYDKIPLTYGSISGEEFSESDFRNLLLQENRKIG